MRIEIEIHIPETGAREKHRCWETAIPNIYQTIVGDQVINVLVDRQNVCEMPRSASQECWGELFGVPDSILASLGLPKLL